MAQAGGTSLQDVGHTWDAGGNLANRNNVLNSDTENFSYDSLDRLTGVSGNYTQSLSYNEIGNILSMNGVSYTYGSKPHAVTSVGGNSYTYDANGNMLTRPNGSIVWDGENRPISITTVNTTTTFVYDGDGNRVKKVEGVQETLYVNKYYEKNLTTGNMTTSYYLGDRLIAQRENTTLKYVHQDSLSSTSLMTDISGSSLGTVSFYPFGATRSGSVPTDIKFTGQRLDSTGLYYYGARYYDPQIGRFISADTIVQDPTNPQSLNRYTYVLNNPLKYVDPSGSFAWIPFVIAVAEWIGVTVGVLACSYPIYQDWKSKQADDTQDKRAKQPDDKHDGQAGPPLTSDKVTPSLPLESASESELNSSNKSHKNTQTDYSRSHSVPGPVEPDVTIGPAGPNTSEGSQKNNSGYTPEQIQQIMEYLDRYSIE